MAAAGHKPSKCKAHCAAYYCFVLRLFKGNVAAILKLNVAYVLLIPILSSFQGLCDGMWGPLTE